MKENEAPERIYLYPSDRAGEEYEDEWGDKPWGKDCVEYIRTDTVIEKAREYFRSGLEDTKVMDDYRDTLVPGIQAQYTSVEEFIEDFINCIKGDTCGNI